MSNASGKSSTSSPVKSSLHTGYEATETKAVDGHEKLVHAMAGLFVGPMPVSDFLEDFLPAKNLPKAPVVSAAFFKDLGKFKNENEMAEKFEIYIPNTLTPGFKIVNISNHRNSDSEKRIRPDLTLYREGVVTTVKKTRFNEIQLQFELKLDDSQDPFDERPDHGFEASAEMRTRCRGQLVSYATEWCSRQHRCFAFTVYIGDPFVRFIRWDRAGAIVSAKFNYREDATPLIDFLWRFAHLGPAERGWDPTVRIARPDEVDLATEKLSRWKNKLRRDVVVFTVPDGEAQREFIAWGSMAYPESLTGRCTRAYPVYEQATGRLCFLKDSWRAEELEKESKILQTLKAALVENIPGYVCGDDLPGDATVTDLYVPVSSQADDSLTKGRDRAADAISSIDNLGGGKRDAPWIRGTDWRRITRRYHHRMVTDVVAHHLKTFTSSKVMMKAISDAFTAHQQAYERCTVIHRDISAHNILITDTGNGILNDWDLARYEDDIIENGPRRHERTGTWQFMSCLLLMDRHKLHTIQDDMESFIYVILYHCLRYLPHNKAIFILLIFEHIFDQQDLLPDGSRLGGFAKRHLIQSRGQIYVLKGFQLTNHNPLIEWLDDVYPVLNEWLLQVEEPVINKENLNGLRLSNHQFMADLFTRCSSLPGWPSGDKAVDALSSLPKGRTGNQIAKTASSNTRSKASSSSRKRRLVTEDADQGFESRLGPKKNKQHGSKTSGSSRSFYNSLVPDGSA